MVEVTEAETEEGKNETKLGDLGEVETNDEAGFELVTKKVKQGSEEKRRAEEDEEGKG